MTHAPLSHTSDEASAGTLLISVWRNTACTPTMKLSSTRGRIAGSTDGIAPKDSFTCLMMSSAASASSNRRWNRIRRTFRKVAEQMVTPSVEPAKPKVVQLTQMSQRPNRYAEGH